MGGLRLLGGLADKAFVFFATVFVSGSEPVDREPHVIFALSAVIRRLCGLR